MIKHIFCDLDGTLYHNNINKADIEAIKSIESKGVGFHIATGRNLKHTKDITSDMAVQGHNINGYYICQNGAYIYDKNYNIISKKTIDEEIARKVINDFVSESAVMYIKYGDDVIVLGDEMDGAYANDYIYDKKFKEKKKFDDIIGNIGVASDDEEELGRIELQYKAKYEEVLDVYFSSPKTINLVPNGASKKDGILEVCKLLNVDVDEVATIGDSPNDISMLSLTKNSFVIKTAREDVKKHAKYEVSDVAEAIKNIVEMNNTNLEGEEK